MHGLGRGMADIGEVPSASMPATHADPSAAPIPTAAHGFGRGLASLAEQPVIPAAPLPHTVPPYAVSLPIRSSAPATPLSGGSGRSTHRPPSSRAPGVPPFAISDEPEDGPHAASRSPPLWQKCR